MGGPTSGDGTHELADLVATLASVHRSAIDLVLLVRAGDDTVLYVNRPVAGLNPDDLRGARLSDHLAAPGTDELAALNRRVAAAAVAEVLEATGKTDSDETIAYRLSVSPVAVDGRVVALFYSAIDITSQKRVEDRLRRNEALLVDTQGVAHLGTWEWDVRETGATWSDELFRIYGLTPETYSPSYEGYLEMVHPDDRSAVRAVTERAFRDHLPYSHDERILRPDGSIRYLHTWTYSVVDARGDLVKLVGVCQDITDRKVAENALAEHARELARTNARLREEMAERERVEKMLRQAHKLEAIGRLAGGVAHDFNNLLGVVVGRSSFMQGRLAANDPMREHVEEIVSAGRLAGRLTQQLLAFSREQLIGRETLHLGRIVSDLEPILRPAVGEAIEIVTRLADPAPYIEADRSQIEQVIMNLVVNARDAMLDGGTVTIEILDVARLAGTTLPAELDPAVPYVVLQVTDTGAGMDESILARAFDPYFTTREGGTGLGLSTVYGIARQSGGTATGSTRPAVGSVFRVFFPRVEPPGAPAVEGPAEPWPAAQSRTVLLVEDQAALRRSIAQQLGDLGYDVLDASGPVEALAVIERRDGGIDLLLTDLVMPQMGGAELAHRVRQRLPDTRVLFFSGWADKALLAGLHLDDGAPLLRKPFTTAELGNAVAAALIAASTDLRP